LQDNSLHSLTSIWTRGYSELWCGHSGACPWLMDMCGLWCSLLISGGLLVCHGSECLSCPPRDALTSQPQVTLAAGSEAPQELCFPHQGEDVGSQVPEQTQPSGHMKLCSPTINVCISTVHCLQLTNPRSNNEPIITRVLTLFWFPLTPFFLSQAVTQDFMLHSA
jgi:hypothetical protein